MENQLKFISTTDVADWKAKNNVSTIRIIKSPKTGKLFFVANDIQGAISTKGYDKTPVVSLCSTPDGEQMYLLHNRQDNNVVATL